jgi:hypothetical protein
VPLNKWFMFIFSVYIYSWRRAYYHICRTHMPIWICSYWHIQICYAHKWIYLFPCCAAIAYGSLCSVYLETDCARISIMSHLTKLKTISFFRTIGMLKSIINDMHITQRFCLLLLIHLAFGRMTITCKYSDYILYIVRFCTQKCRHHYYVFYQSARRNKHRDFNACRKNNYRVLLYTQTVIFQPSCWI